MRVIARRTLLAYVASLAGKKDQPAVKAALDAWFHEVRQANWRNAAEVKNLYARASIISADRIVFDIKGNSYRLITAVDFEKSIVWIMSCHPGMRASAYAGPTSDHFHTLLPWVPALSCAQAGMTGERRHVVTPWPARRRSEAAARRWCREN